MSQLSQCHEPGLLLVLSKPKSPDYLEDFHGWYNTEHGPARMKLDFIQNGYRYQSGGSQPVWAGIYDLARVSALTEPQYTKLREERSKREQDLLATKVHILERKIYRKISSRGHSLGPAPIILKVSFVIKNTLAGECHRWYEQEHIDDLSRIPGWRQSRRYEAIGGDEIAPDCTELLAIHEFDQQNGLGGPEHIFARSRPWRNRIVEIVESRENTQLEFYHEFRAGDYRRPSETSSASTSAVRPTGLIEDGLSKLQTGIGASEHVKLTAHRVAPPAVY